MSISALVPLQQTSKPDAAPVLIPDRCSPQSPAHLLSSPLMLVLFVLLISLVIFRGVGTLGVSAFATWIACTRCALAVMFLFTSTAHFNKLRHNLARMMPKVFPNPLAMVYFTGVCEILGAIGILVPRARSLAGLCLVIFLLAILPANVKAARESLTIGGRSATALWLRIPMQILFLAAISWSTQPWALFLSLFGR